MSSRVALYLLKTKMKCSLFLGLLISLPFLMKVSKILSCSDAFSDTWLLAPHEKSAFTKLRFAERYQALQEAAL